MGRAGLGAALQSLGQSVPGIGASVDQSRMDLLKMEIAKRDDLRAAQQEFERQRKIAQDQEAKDATTGALGKFSQFERGARLADTAPKTIPGIGGTPAVSATGTPMARQTTLDPDQSRDLGAIMKAQDRGALGEDPTSRGMARAAGVSASADPRAKALLGDISAQEREGRPTSVFAQQQAFQTPENVAENTELVDNLVASNKIGPEDEAIFRAENKTNAFGLRKKLASMGAAVTTAVRSQSEQLPGKVKEAEETTAARTRTKILTEAYYADLDAITKGKIEGGKLKGKRDAGLTVTATNAERIGDFSASFAQLGVLTDSFSNPEAPQGPISQLRKANPYDWQAQAKQQLVASTKQLVGKALEGGVLRAEDERKYEKILPKIGDTFEAAVQKAANLRTMLNNTYEARISALNSAGYDMSGFSQTLLTEDAGLGGPSFGEDKRKRLEELRRKRDEGTLK